ncbi:MAG TPA: DNA polymerase III subunit delta [Saprospiraceae bacterium]|nr:DNA polymerase III subunit delta [Saprospiraceae bacterium]
MDYKDLINQLQKNQFHPVYFLTGEEDYYIDRLIDWFEEKIIPAQERDFNQYIVYGRDSNAKKIVELCRQFPLGGERSLVLLKEAQEIKDKDWDGIEAYLSRPASHCILAIAYKHKKPDGRLAWVKAVKDKSLFFESKSIKDAQVPAFIQELGRALQLKIDDSAASLMAEFIGNQLNQIHNELQKIKLNLGDGTLVDKEMISEQIGVSKEYNAFELQKAFSGKDGAKVMKIAHNMGLHIKNNPLVVTTALLFNHFQRIWLVKYYGSKPDKELAGILKLSFASFLSEYRAAAQKYSLPELERIFSLLREFDLKSKGVDVVQANHEELLSELCSKILFAHSAVVLQTS